MHGAEGGVLWRAWVLGFGFGCEASGEGEGAKHRREKKPRAVYEAKESHGRFELVIRTSHQLRDSIVVSISACHAEDPGSIPGRGSFHHIVDQQCCVVR